MKCCVVQQSKKRKGGGNGGEISPKSENDAELSVEESVDPISSEPAEKADVTVDKVVEKLTPTEAAVLKDFRNAQKAAKAAKQEFEETRESQDSWGDLLASDDDDVEMFSKFHAHFAEIEFMDQADLVQQAKSELCDVKRWKAPDKEKVRTALIEALPAMSVRSIAPVFRNHENWVGELGS